MIEIGGIKDDLGVLKEWIYGAEEMLSEIDDVNCKYENGKCQMIDCKIIDLSLCEEQIQMIFGINDCLERLQGLFWHFVNDIKSSYILDETTRKMYEESQRTESIARHNRRIADMMQELIAWHKRDDWLQDNVRLTNAVSFSLLEADVHFTNAVKVALDLVDLYDVSQSKDLVSVVKAWLGGVEVE